MTAAADTATPLAAGRPFKKGHILCGFAIIAAFICAFIAWSLLAPIESAVVAPGVISVDTDRKTIQHLEGGIVESIYVRDGDHVKTGQALIRLQNTFRLSVVNQLQAQYLEARAAEARLVAEHDRKDKIEFPEELRQKVADEAAQAAMAGQRNIFESRRKLLDEKLAVLTQQIAALDEEIAGLNGQIKSSNKQTALIDDELVGILKLYEKNLISKSRLLGLQRNKAEIEGAVSGYRASIARANQDKQELRLRMTELETSAVTEVVEELRSTRAKAYDLQQQLAATNDVLRRTEIRSPIDGTVVGLKIRTLGGVIEAGQPLLDIVPSNEDLIVNASIDSRDIEEVRAGLPVRVRLTALNRRNQTPIDGEIKTVSADRLIDPHTGFAYYLARIELQTDSPQFKDMTLQPGMGADVMILTGLHTPWDYLLRPITRFLDLGMREK